jgi:outer membrane lipoprotein-sorting protein
MMDRRTFLVGLAWSASAMAIGREAHADDISDTLAEITKARAGLKSLVAPFSQEREMGLLSTSIKSEGEMTLVRPDRLRWELKAPDAITYWVTPEGFAYANADGSKTIGRGGAGNFAAGLSDMLVLLGGDLDKLRSRYAISIPKRDGTGVVVRAKPTAPDISKLFKSLEMTAGPELWTVKSFTLEEANGDRSTVTFTKLQRDVAVDAARMRPPK